eukprot:scaffold4029_cov117-Isochrysis_galbana.AAC.1
MAIAPELSLCLRGQRELALSPYPRPFRPPPAPAGAVGAPSLTSTRTRRARSSEQGRLLARDVLDVLRQCFGRGSGGGENGWTSISYPHLCSPVNPCLRHVEGQRAEGLRRPRRRSERGGVCDDLAHRGGAAAIAIARRFAASCASQCASASASVRRLRRGL